MAAELFPETKISLDELRALQAERLRAVRRHPKAGHAAEVAEERVIVL